MKISPGLEGVTPPKIKSFPPADFQHKFRNWTSSKQMVRPLLGFSQMAPKSVPNYHANITSKQSKGMFTLHRKKANFKISKEPFFHSGKDCRTTRVHRGRGLTPPEPHRAPPICICICIGIGGGSCVCGALIWPRPDHFRVIWPSQGRSDDCRPVCLGFCSRGGGEIGNVTQ